MTYGPKSRPETTVPEQPTLHALPKIEDERGNLSFIEEGDCGLPEMRRAYWIYDVPGGEVRGSHAYAASRELIVALSGSFDVVLRSSDGTEQRIHLCRSYRAVHVPPRTWRTLENFSTNSLGLVLASTYYDEDDYIWDEHQIATQPLPPASQHPDLPLSGLPHPVAVHRRSILPEMLRPARTFTLDDCRLVELPRFTEMRRGCLTPIEECSSALPFCLRRVFYIYDIPSGASRGTHGHRAVWEFIVAASSCFEVDVDDGLRRRTFRLDRPYRGLLVPPGLWVHLRDFSSAAVALVLSSAPYDAADNINDRAEFLRFRGLDEDALPPCRTESETDGGGVPPRP